MGSGVDVEASEFTFGIGEKGALGPIPANDSAYPTLTGTFNLVIPFAEKKVTSSSTISN
jgi:hypothetical protein